MLKTFDDLFGLPTAIHSPKISPKCMYIFKGIFHIYKYIYRHKKYPDEVWKDKRHMSLLYFVLRREDLCLKFTCLQVYMYTLHCYRTI